MDPWKLWTDPLENGAYGEKEKIFTFLHSESYPLWQNPITVQLPINPVAHTCIPSLGFQNIQFIDFVGQTYEIHTCHDL